MESCLVNLHSWILKRQGKNVAAEKNIFMATKKKQDTSYFFLLFFAQRDDKLRYKVGVRNMLCIFFFQPTLDEAMRTSV